MFGNLLNNYFYGKAGKGDYTVQSMPQNRFELFFSVLKVRWASLFGINLLYMIVWIPTLIWTYMNFALLLSGDETVSANIASYFMTYLLGLIPCIFITGPFTAGVAYVTRNWARDEHSFVLSDFWDALKANWKQSLVVSLISGLMPAALYMAWTYYGQMATTSSPVFLVPLAIVFIVFIVWKLAELVIYTMMVTYDLKIGALIRNSVLMALARLPMSVGIKIITWIIPAVAIALLFLAPGIEIYVLLVLALLYILIVPAFNRLITASYANGLCEKFLNEQIEGAQTNIGLRPENWDDTEYIPQDDEE